MLTADLLSAVSGTGICLDSETNFRTGRAATYPRVVAYSRPLPRILRQVPLFPLNLIDTAFINLAEVIAIWMALNAF